MANKGDLNVKVDIPALNEVTVFASTYRKEVSDACASIRNICLQMENEESLKGGDGEQIRNSFMEISKACANLDKSVQFIVDTLNDRIETAIKMRHGSSVGDTADSTKKAAAKVGVLKQ